MLEYPEELFGQRALGDAVVIIQRGLGAPADVEGAVHVGAAPLHYAAELGPVVDLLEGHVLHGSPGDDQTVEIAVLDVLEALVELDHVLLGRMRGLVGAGLDQLKLDLERGVRDEPHELGLGLYLGGHQVQYSDLQRSDVLGVRPQAVHDEYILVGKGLVSGKVF